MNFFRHFRLFSLTSFKSDSALSLNKKHNHNQRNESSPANRFDFAVLQRPIVLSNFTLLSPYFSTNSGTVIASEAMTQETTCTRRLRRLGDCISTSVVSVVSVISVILEILGKFLKASHLGLLHIDVFVAVWSETIQSCRRLLFSSLGGKRIKDG